MHWLSQRGAVIDTLNRTVQLNSPCNNSKILICLPTPKRVVERVYGASVKAIKDILVVREFSDVFPDDLPSLL
jgi:hypothetical protein